MELVYLWVEEYKNIKEQGFNFSPRFKCDFDGENLTIDEKEDYISIFPDNINITAIVGENGSGKSSIIDEIINKIIFNTKIEYKIHAPLICFLSDDKKCIYICSNLIESTTNIFSEFKHRLTHYYPNDSFPSNLDKEYTNTEYGGDTKLSKKFKEEYYKSFFYLYNNSLEKDLNHHHIYEYNEELLFSSEINKSDDVINIQKEIDKTLSYLITLLYNQDRIPKQIKNFYLPTKLFLDREILTTYFKGKYEEEELKYHTLLKSNCNKKDILKLETILYLRYFIKSFDVLHQETMKEEIEDIFENINIVESYNEIYTELESIANKYIKRIQLIKKDIRYNDNRSNDSAIKDLNELEKIFRLIVNIDKFVLLIKEINNKSDTDYEMNIELLNEEEAIELKQLPSYLKVNFANKNGRYFDDVSSGEYNLLRLLLSIENIIHLRKEKTDSLYILLDEIENTFHPDWQKRILNWLIEFVKHFNIKINIIITTHSPFLLSDLPKEYIIFLKDGKEEKAFEHNQTFGANIHTLLSDGFFMKDGLMGEFAKNKIEEVIKLLKSKRKLSVKNKEFCKHIISIIGEPILQKTLEYQLNEKLNSNETELQRLEREQIELQERITKLKESTKNETN